jgi:hypothetical protein
MRSIGIGNYCAYRNNQRDGRIKAAEAGRVLRDNCNQSILVATVQVRSVGLSIVQRARMFEHPVPPYHQCKDVELFQANGAFGAEA